MKKLLIIQILLGCLFSTVVFAEPKDLEKENPPTKQVFQSMKPVTCTSDSYDVVKKNFADSHGEVGLMRYYGDEKTGVEIIGNTNTGSITILEYLPTNKWTCFISMGKGLEINSLIFEQTKKGIETNYLVVKSLDNGIPMWYK